MASAARRTGLVARASNLYPSASERPVPQIQIYSKSWCPYCQMAKRLLRAKGQVWEEVDLEEQPSRCGEMLERSGGRSTVPQIWIGERHVGGFDELSALEAAGELDALLAQ